MIVALAGRRIDAPGTSPERFPARSVPLVRNRIEAALRESGATALVSAAACGADLTALEVAQELGIRRRIVLPFTSDRFRAGSVVDRPGEWGALYDRMIALAQSDGDLEILDLPEQSDDAYQATNLAILDRALGLADEAHRPVSAFVVWDGPDAGRTDYTKDFADAAAQRHIAIVTISSLP